MRHSVWDELVNKLDFNDNGVCHCMTRVTDDVRICLLHDAMLSEPRVLNSRGAGNIGRYSGEDYVYAKHEVIPETFRGRNLMLEFEGVSRDAEVFRHTYVSRAVEL